MSGSDYDSLKANYAVAKASVSVAESSVAQAKASTVQGRAAVERAQRNLDFCTIKSPVTGVIIDRRVNIGQTVVASLNAPSLFLIAKDLLRMQIWVGVNEADVGRILPGAPVTFTCDAFPGREFLMLLKLRVHNGPEAVHRWEQLKLHQQRHFGATTTEKGRPNTEPLRSAG